MATTKPRPARDEVAEVARRWLLARMVRVDNPEGKSWKQAPYQLPQTAVESLIRRERARAVRIVRSHFGASMPEVTATASAALRGPRRRRRGGG